MQEFLVVGADRGHARRLTELLRDSGIDSRRARSVDEALRLAQLERIEGIFCCHPLASGSVFALIDALRGRASAPPVTVVSEFARSHEAAMAVKRGAFDYLPAPFDPSEVQACVNRMRRAHRLENGPGNIRFEADAGIFVIVFPAEVSYEDAIALNRLIEAGLPLPERGVIADVSATSYFSSTGIGSLFLLHEHYESLPRRIVIAGANVQVRYVLRLAGADACFDFAESTADAKAALETADAPHNR